MLKRITRKLAILAVLAGMLSGLAPSMLAVRTAHADEASQSGASTALDRSSAPAPKRSEAAKPEPLTSADVQVRSAVVPSDALASGTAGTCLFYITSDMRLTVTPADGTSGTLPTGVNASDWPWYRYAAYIRSVSFDPGVKTSSTLKNAFSSASTTDPEYSQLKSIDLANLDMADLRSVYTAFANDTRLGSVSFKGALNADGITDWTSVFFQSGIESIDLTDVGDAATTVHGLFQGCRSLKTAVIPWAMAHVANAGGMFDGCAGLTSLDTSVWRFGSMTNAGRMFRNCSNLAALDVSGWDVSHVATFESTFDGCSGLTSLDTSSWNTANAMHTGYMFRNCSNLAVLDVSGWSMGRVWFANGMFCKCARLTVLDVSEWDVHALQQAANMFQGCSELAVLDVSAWNTASLVYASATFQNCAKLTTLDVADWRMGKVRTISNMFGGCTGLTRLDVSKWKTGGIRDMQGTFTSCTGLTVLDVSKWDVSNATNMYAMFQNCTGLTELDVAAWDVSNVATFGYMFFWCPKLAGLDVSKWDTSNATGMYEMFHYDAKLTVLDVSKWKTGKVRSFSNMFSGCSGLTGLDVADWDTSNATGINAMFYGCTGLTRLDVSKWKTGGIRDMQGTFAYCTNLAMLDLSSWDTSNTIHLNQMFDNCRNLTDVGDLSAWDTSNVTGMTWMFSNDRRLSRLDVSKWNVRNVLNMTGMFADCVGLSTLDLSGWNTDSLTTTPSMFRNLTVTRIYVGDNWTVDNVTGSDLMFTGCTRLVGDDGKGLAYDASKLTAAYARADGGYMTFKGERTVYHKVTFAALDGKTITTMRVKDGGMATAPSLADTTWLADPDMDFNTDGWGGAITAQGKRQTGRDDYSTSAKRHVDANSTIRVDADADYRNAVAGGALGYHLKRDLDGQSDWSGYGCAKGTVCTDVVWYSTIGYSGTVQGFTQISAWSDFGAAVVHHLQLTQVDPVTHNGIARDGYVFTGWDKDVTKPITGDTVYTARYRPAVYRIWFDGNGSTSGAMSDQLFTYGTPQALTAATFQRDGYSLTGWNTRPDGTGKSFTDKQTVADLLTHENAVGTLYAQWTPTPPVITVVFHSNDGGTDETVKRVWASNNLDMKAIGLPDGWTKKGFAFHGWNLAADGSGVEYKTGESLYGRMTTATVDLYADWAGLQSTLPQAGGILHAAPVAGLSIMMLGVPLLILARRHRHGHANPPV